MIQNLIGPNLICGLITPIIKVKIIDKMIIAFEWIAKDEMEEDEGGVKEGLDLFREYFLHLWD